MDFVALARLPLLISCLSGIAVFTLLLGIIRQVRLKRGATLEDRIHQLELQRQQLATMAAPSGQQGQMAQAINRLAARSGFAQQLAEDLVRADVRLTVGEFLIMMALMMALSVLAALWLHNVLLGTILLIASYYGPRWWVGQRRTKRLRKFDLQLAGTIALMANVIRANGNINDALRLAASDSQPPISVEFGRVVREVDMGFTVQEALGRLTGHVPSIDLQLLVTAFNVQMESGGNLVQMLDRICETIRERVKLQGEIQALTAQQRYTGYVVALMPVAMVLFLLVVNPGYILGVFQTTVWCGWAMFSAAVVMITAGVFVIQRIVDVKV